MEIRSWTEWKQEREVRLGVQSIQEVEYGENREEVNEISKLRSTALSPHGLNTVVAIVMSSPAELHKIGVSARVCYLLMESRVQM